MSLKEYPDILYLFDGAFGTYYAQQYEDDSPCELANLHYPQRVRKIHEQYCQAGCNAIKTNTFSANIQSLEEPQAQIDEILKQGYRLAKQVADIYGAVAFADIGPMTQEKNVSLFTLYQAIVDVFLKEGAKHFLFETFYNQTGLKEIASYIKSQCPDSFIIVSFALSADGYTRQGFSGEKLLQEMDECEDIDAVGLNCICGPRHLDNILKRISIKHHPISMMPNAGYPTILHNRTFYRNNSEYFAQEMMQIIQDGARIIGGCCGTTPAYMKAIKEALLHLVAKDNDFAPTHQQVRIPIKKDPLHQKLADGKKIIAVEFDPPQNCDIEKFMQNAQVLKELGVDALTIADCPVARARADSSLLACKLHREMNLSIIPHMTCRDRNLNATKALLYGLQIEGVQNVLVVTGDPIPAEERTTIKAVFNFNSQLLAGFIADLNETVFPQPFLICGALNINAVNFDAELEKAKRKEANGVSCFMTQPVCSNRALQNLKKAKQELSSKLLGGILPIVSHRNAVYMNNEISGIDIDEEIISLYEGKSREEASELAVKICKQIANEIYDIVDGYYLITPFNRVDVIAKIVACIPKCELQEAF